MQPMPAMLEAIYRDTVQARMQGLAVYNPALRVEAHGFTSRDGHCCGVLITPWCMNLVLLPGDGESWTGLAPGSRVEVAFPAATYSLTLSLPMGIQPHLSLTLFTTVLDFPNQDTARQVADEVLKRLYRAEAQTEHAEPVGTESDRPGLCRPLSRRDLLHGRWAPTGGRQT